MKINSDNNLLLEGILNIHNVVTLIRYIFDKTVIIIKLE